jgi:hypothetical protein
MTLAPNTKVTFSTSKQLSAMGFSDDQIGDRQGKKQFVFENKSMTDSLTIQAEHPPNAKLLVTTLSIRIYPASENFVSPVEHFQIAFKEYQKNLKLLRVVSRAIRKLSDASNLQFNLTLSDTKFNLSFPENPNIVAALNVPVDLAFRLGYGFITQITKELVSQAKPDVYDANNTASKARALVYDTAQVIVTMDNTSSNLNSVTGDLTMASLYATHTGSLEILPGFVGLPTMVKLPFYASGTNKIPVSFQLSRFNDDDTLMPFQWKTGAYIYGTLRGIDQKV